jgi:hypothetical protein
VQRYLRDSAILLALELTDVDDLPTPASAVAVTITDSAGVALTGSPFAGTPVLDDDDQPCPGAFTVAVPVAQAGVLDVYTVDAEYTIDDADPQRRRSQFEIVGGFLFGLQKLRDSDDELGDDADDPPPAQVLRDARDGAMDRFEHRCRPSFWRRGRRVRLDGKGLEVLVLPDLYPQEIISISVDGVALTSDQLAVLTVYEWGGLGLTADVWPRGYRNIELFYEHGLDSSPQVVSSAGVKLAKSYVIKSPIPDRATSESTGDGSTWRVSVAGRDGPTGIPEVDAILGEFEGGGIVVG